MTSLLAGCGPSADPPSLARALPPPPSFAQPAPLVDPKPGEPILAVAARDRATAAIANERIVSFREWYETLRRDYGALP